MSLLERVLACRRHDLAGMLPFELGGERYGWVRAALAQDLADVARSPFRLEGGTLRLDPALATSAARTQAVDGCLARLREAGRLPAWRGERYAVVRAWGAAEAMQVERAAVPWLGVRAFGVHVNGWVRGARGPLLWVARRSRHKPSHPGKLDHLVAGGQPAGLSLRQNLVKEAMEEASVPASLAEQAVGVAPFRYRLLTPDGLRDDTLFTYDLELPEGFQPQVRDGEVESFRLVPADEVLAMLRSSDEFKPNVVPCILGFLLRQGVVGERDPERSVLLRELGEQVLRPHVPEEDAVLA